jgi:hypothetical protein
VQLHKNNASVDFQCWIEEFTHGLHNMEMYRNFGSDMKLNLYVRVNSVVSLCLVCVMKGSRVGAMNLK